jgi:hypothetical protein
LLIKWDKFGKETEKWVPLNGITVNRINQIKGSNLL